MKMDRKALVAQLELLRPALAKKDIIEQLTCVWFSGNHMWAYDDSLGIVTPFPTEFQGGVRGEQLLGFLDKSRAREVDVKVINGGKEIHLAIGKGFRSNLVLLEMDQAMWEAPEFNVRQAFEITPDFLTGLESVQASVGRDTSIPDQLGVTLKLEGDTLNFYSTDTKTLSWAWIPKPEGYTIEYAIFPEVFCKQMVRVCEPGSQLGILTDNTVLVRTPSGRFIFSRLIESQRPLDYQAVVREHMIKYDQFVPIPDRMRLSIDRIIVLFENAVGEPCEIMVADDIIRFHAQSPLGEVKDIMKIENHPEALAYFDPNSIKKVIPHQDRIFITDTCMLMSKQENLIHFIAPCDSKELR